MKLDRRAAMAGAVGLGACAHAGGSSAGDEAAIRALLAAQDAAWNRGDIAGFMAGYWRDARLRFASGDKVTRGYEETLAGYQRRYPDRAAMGRLSFSELEIDFVGPNAAIVFGRWRLERAGDAPGGLFTLTVKRFAEGWRIVADHTS